MTPPYADAPGAVRATLAHPQPIGAILPTVLRTLEDARADRIAALATGTVILAAIVVAGTVLIRDPGTVAIAGTFVALCVAVVVWAAAKDGAR